MWLFMEKLTHLKKIGDIVQAGELIGTVQTVLKKYKRPSNDNASLRTILKMKETVWWEHGRDKPNELLDPTNLLIESKNIKSKINYYVHNFRESGA